MGNSLKANDARRSLKILSILTGDQASICPAYLYIQTYVFYLYFQLSHSTMSELGIEEMRKKKFTKAHGQWMFKTFILTNCETIA